MDAFQVLAWVFYFVMGILTWNFLRRHGYRVASLLYAGLFSVLAIYMFVFIGCNLSGLLVKPFVERSFFENFMIITVGPTAMFLPYTSMASVVVGAFSLFILLSLLAATVEIVRTIITAKKGYILIHRGAKKSPRIKLAQIAKYNKPVWLCLCRITS